MRDEVGITTKHIAFVAPSFSYQQLYHELSRRTSFTVTTTFTYNSSSVCQTTQHALTSKFDDMAHHQVQHSLKIKKLHTK